MKPSIPKGTRDFTPVQVQKRRFIFETLREVFVQFGYQPIETPVMENLMTLTGKYGEEGDRLLFKVLNNGDFLAKADPQALENRDSDRLIPSISKRGLRYDLTVPFARFVVMNQHELSFPFKRYQIQPVWRADRPQKGRYQEFYQCDVDVVGSDSLMYEAELIEIYDKAFDRLGLKVSIHLNNRKILAGMAEVAGIVDDFTDMTMAIDKLDKVGMEGVKKELSHRGISNAAIEKITEMLGIRNLDSLKDHLASSEIGLKGIAELTSVMKYLGETSLKNEVQFDITLARGLNYYTGCIFEVKALDAEMGSLGGGGRYDDLTGVFGLKNVSGVGVSFGAERIYDLMEEKDLFPERSPDSLRILLIAFDESTHHFAFRAVSRIREAGINADLYPEPAKIKKQMKYANDLGVPFVLLIGEKEMESGRLTLKDMKSGEQEELALSDIISKFS